MRGVRNARLPRRPRTRMGIGGARSAHGEAARLPARHRHARRGLRAGGDRMTFDLDGLYGVAIVVIMVIGLLAFLIYDERRERRIAREQRARRRRSGWPS